MLLDWQENFKRNIYDEICFEKEDDEHQFRKFYPLVLSIISLGFVGGYLILHPKLGIQPYRLIGVTCIFEGISMFHSIGVHLDCYTLETSFY